jgi:peptidoglycan/LPS O-acetylase OafA/YrhL
MSDVSGPEATITRLTYRPDIDGLRALAVLPVIVFHLGVPWTKGGFVGVDVFYVISGYLITSIIRTEIADGRFTLTGFFERRVRRILPALFVVIAVTLAVATAIFMPADLRNTAQSAIAALVFASNVLFFLEAGYFDTSVFAMPLLHTWTLAVEEQFYLVVPLMMMALARWSARPVIWIGGLTLASFALSALTTPLMPNAAFYLIPWRAWELGIGAVLAFGTGPRLPRGGREAAAAAGVALILGAVLVYDEGTTFPGVAALAPTLGAALVIVAGASGPTLAGHLLSTRPAVWIGRLSYSLYLWHWPIIVFYVYWAMEMPTPAVGMALLALCFAAAWLSWRFVERPFRVPPGQRAPGRRPRLAAVAARPFLAAGAGAAMLGVAAAAIDRLDGLPGRLPPGVQAAAAFASDFPPRRRPCFVNKHDDGSWLAPCVFGDPDGPVRMTLWGDSHAPSLMPALDAAARAAGIGATLYAHNGCAPAEGLQIHWIGEDHDCRPFLETTRPAILADPDIALVVLTMRAPMYTQGWLPYGIAERKRSEIRIGTASAPLPAAVDRNGFFVERLERTVAALRAAGKQVALVYPLPEAGASVPEAYARVLLRGGGAEDVALPRQRFDARAGDLIAAFDEIVERHGAIPIRLHEALCDDGACQLVRDGTPIFRDANHLTATAARDFAAAFGPLAAAVAPAADPDGTACALGDVRCLID